MEDEEEPRASYPSPELLEEWRLGRVPLGQIPEKGTAARERCQRVHEAEPIVIQCRNEVIFVPAQRASEIRERIYEDRLIGEGQALLRQRPSPLVRWWVFRRPRRSTEKRTREWAKITAYQLAIDRKERPLVAVCDLRAEGTIGDDIWPEEKRTPWRALPSQGEAFASLTKSAFILAPRAAELKGVFEGDTNDEESVSLAISVFDTVRQTFADDPTVTNAKIWAPPLKRWNWAAKQDRHPGPTAAVIYGHPVFSNELELGFKFDDRGVIQSAVIEEYDSREVGQVMTYAKRRRLKGRLESYGLTA